MREYEILFSKNLAQKLVEKVKGKVLVKVTTNDELFVSIDCWHDIRFRTTLGNFSEKIMHGWSTDYACYEIQKRYEKFLLQQYLK